MTKYSTCFLIDDDQDDQEIFELALTDVNKNLQCVFANDALEALIKLRNDQSFTPNYIFIDLNMPKMNGIECLKEIKKIGRLAQIPIIIYSTSSEPQDLYETKSLGASGYLVKPSSITDLTDNLAEFFLEEKKHSLAE